MPIGLCGLLKRDTLPDVDVGFAFLPDYCSAGYAFEAVTRGDDLREGNPRDCGRFLANTSSPDNNDSIRLLEKIGPAFEGLITLPEQGEVRLFGTRVLRRT